MLIRPYSVKDKEQCLSIFDSNCPTYFDQSERDMFRLWLDHKGNENINYASPAYTNAKADDYYVIELPTNEVIGCAGFYILKDSKEVRLAWGMIHSNHQQKGYGTLLYKHRKDLINKNWPQHLLTLGTSQHTFGFYQKMGMKVQTIINKGYGALLDKYDMRE